MKDKDFFHPIRVVALKTGLSPHLIRVWERRYRAVNPDRTPSRRRRYSDQEVERLKLLQMLTGSGHSIGSIATLEIEQLRALHANGGGVRVPTALEKRREDRQAEGRQLVSRCVHAVATLDQAGLEGALQDGAVTLGQQGVLLHVVAPLAEEVGRQWQEGHLGIAHEHFASAILRTFLGNMSRQYAASESAPHLIAATPSGQLHEIGAMLITAAAAVLGWRSTYLGASLSPVEIVSTLRQKPARAIGLSIVYPPDDPGVAAELRALKKLLPEGVALLVGGRAAAGYRPVLDEIGACFCGGPLSEFMDRLNERRAGAVD
jgi:methanogenic corrinoid protein MtbC1/transposase-like protein